VDNDGDDDDGGDDDKYDDDDNNDDDDDDCKKYVFSHYKSVNSNVFWTSILKEISMFLAKNQPL